MNWLNIEQLVKFYTAKFTHRIIYTQFPIQFAQKMGVESLVSENEVPQNNPLVLQNRNRSRAANKPGPYPVNIVRTYTSHMSQTSFIYRSFQIYNEIPDLITKIKKKNLFKKWYKRYLINNADIPPPDYHVRR